MARLQPRLSLPGERVLWSLPRPGLVAARGEMQGERLEAWGFPLLCLSGSGRPSEQFSVAGRWPGCSSDMNGLAEDPSGGDTSECAPISVPVRLGAVHVGSVSAQCSEALWVTEARLQAWDVSPVTILWCLGWDSCAPLTKARMGPPALFVGLWRAARLPKQGSP